jgi:hypothetical protein
MHKLDLKLGSKQYYKTNLMHLIVVQQLSGGWWPNYSTKTRQAVCVNEHSIYSQLSMHLPSNYVPMFLK